MKKQIIVSGGSCEVPNISVGKYSSTFQDCCHDIWYNYTLQAGKNLLFLLCTQEYSQENEEWQNMGLEIK